MKIVYVAWWDTQQFSGWRDMGNLSDILPAPSSSVGFLIRETKTDIIIATSIGGKKDIAADLLCIPKGCIQKVKVLKK